MLTVGGLDSPNISTELRSQTRNLSVGHDDPFERESVGRNSADIGPYKDSWLALDPHEAAVCLRHLTQMLRLMRFDDLLADNGVEPVTGEARQRGRSASHHTRRKRIMGVGEVPSVSDVSTQPQEGDVVTGGNATFGQEQFWKLLAAVEASAEKQKEFLDGAKERDTKIERILEDIRTQGEQFRDFRREITFRANASEARTKVLETKVEGLAAQMAGVTQQLTGVQGQVNQVQNEFTRLKPAMEDLIALKARVYAILMAFGAIMSLALLYGGKIIEMLTHISLK
jgi:hypothetical protein